MFNFQELFAKANDLQENMQKMRERLNDVIVEGESGGRMVVVSCNANRRILKVQIDPSIMQDQEMVEDLICAAVNRAIEKADEKAKEETQKITGNILPNIPGLDLSRFGL
jgi:nucleoid-associated protein EbfC